MSRNLETDFRGSRGVRIRLSSVVYSKRASHNPISTRTASNGCDSPTLAFVLLRLRVYGMKCRLASFSETGTLRKRSKMPSHANERHWVANAAKWFCENIGGICPEGMRARRHSRALPRCRTTERLLPSGAHRERSVTRGYSAEVHS